MPTKRWKRTEYADEIWQWNGPEDNRGVVHTIMETRRTMWEIHVSSNHSRYVFPSNYIIHTGDTYQVVTNAEFEAQGWEEVTRE